MCTLQCFVRLDFVLSTILKILGSVLSNIFNILECVLSNILNILGFVLSNIFKVLGFVLSTTCILNLLGLQPVDISTNDQN
jgi:phage-related protein